MLTVIWFNHRDQQLYESVKAWLGRGDKIRLVASAGELGRIKSGTREKIVMGPAIISYYEDNEKYFEYLRYVAKSRKVIVWSGYALNDFQTKCLAAGAFRCVTKNDTQGFVTALKEALKN